jgi:uncharacterized membrane protein
VGVASYASAVVAQKVALRRVSALQTTFLCCLVGTIASLPFAPSLIDETAAAPGASLAWVVYLGVFPTALAFTTWAYALARTSAGRLGATIYLVPPISVLLSWIVLSEAPPALAFAGGALCLLGVALSRRGDGEGARRAESALPRRRMAARLWSVVAAAWGAVIGLVPHVLHHAGPLSGAALLAGAGGRLLFAAVGIVAAIPLLRRLYRRFGTWQAPAIALAVFAAMFSLSSLVIGPAISDGNDTPSRPGIEQQHGHGQRA